MTAPAQSAESATPKVPPRPAKLPRGRPRAHRLSAEDGIAYLEQVAAEQGAEQTASCARASSETSPPDPTAPAKRPRGRPRKARPVTPLSTAGSGTQPASAPAAIPIPSITPERLAHLTDLVDRVDASEMLLSFMSYCWRRPHEPLLPGPHTRAIAARIDKAVEDYAAGRSTYLEIVVPFRHGKALAVDTPIPTPSGWSAMGHLRPGDLVYGMDGKPTRVLAVSPVWRDRPVYSVSVDAGRDAIIADADHVWMAKLDRRQATWSLYDTAAMARPRRFTCPVPMTPVLDGAEASLPIPPYTLGYWLGDGSSQRGSITCGDDDRNFIRGQIEADGFKTRMQSDGKSFGVLGLQRPLRLAGLILNKHIPAAYLRASKADRISLLQGLMDSDGEVGGPKKRPGRSSAMSGGQATFSNTNRRLAEGVLELVRTLGVKASLTESRAMLYGIDCGAQYKVSFYLKDCARLPRKRERTRDATRFFVHSVRVTPAGTADTVCIQVEAADGMFLAGRSMVPTHNSDLASRYLPAWFLGRFPDAEVMSTAYAADLSQGFSRDVKSIINDERYANVFPGVSLDTGTNNASERRIAGRAGRLYAVGRGGAATGRGCSLLVVDDMIKNREEADSAVVREAAWRSLTDDFMTRLAPVHIVLVVNTRWHVDDICGRIHERTDPKGEHYDAAFPSFERLHYSARVEGGGYLHEARFGRSWYEAQYATLGPYGSAALLDGEPVVRGGNFIQTDGIQWVEEFPAGVAWVRCWDLASTEKEVAKSDPDWTVGARVAVDVDEAGAETLCVDDVVMIRAEASRRNALIKATARRDAAHGVPQWIEAVAGYKDSYTTLRDALAGVAVVSRITLSGDKVVRAGRIEPHFAAGRVMMRRGAPWKGEVVKQLQDFPSGRHDDVVDAISSGYVAAVERAKRLKGLGVGVGRGAR